MLQTLPQVRGDLISWATSDIPRVPTGYSLIDGKTGGGPAPGELVMFIARTGVGKTWWALNVLARNAQTPSIFFSLEMHSRYLLKRLAGIHTNTPTREIERALRETGRSGMIDMTVDDFPLLSMADRPSISIPDMLQGCDDYENQMGVRPRLLVIDFMELIQAYGIGSSETESVKKVAKGLKDLAREADAVTIVLHQASRGDRVKRRGDDQSYVNEGHRPLSKGDAMHGGEQAADYMIGAFRPGLDPEMPAQIRYQRRDDFRLQFLKTRGDEEIDPHEAVQHHWDQPTGRITEIDWSMYE